MKQLAFDRVFSKRPVRSFESPRRTACPQRSFRARMPPDMSGLYDYQKVGVRWLRERTRGLLSDEQGLGKTAQLLRAIPSHLGAFVVIPAMLAGVWRDQAAKWRPDLRVVFDETRPASAGEIVVQSYDSLPDFPAVRTRPLGQDWSQTILCLDECHYVKGASAQRTQKVRRLGPHCAGIWAMTGTPLLNTPEDLWGVLCSCHLEREVFGTDARREFQKLFRARWIEFKPGRGGWRFGRPMPEVRAMLAPFMLRRTREEELPDLPRKTYADVPVPLTDDIRIALDEAETTWASFGLEDLPPFEMLSAARAALAQAKTGFAMRFVDDTATLDSPVVVFSAHRAPVEAIGGLKGARMLLGGMGARETDEAVSEFQAGKLRILAGTIGAMGVGLTLTRSCHAIFVDRDFTPGDNEQAEDRIARIGQRRNVLVTRLVSEHALDRRLNQILDRKQKTIHAVLGKD